MLSMIRIWELGKYESYEMKPIFDPLDSDMRYRQDLTTLKTGNLDLAQVNKIYIPNLIYI